MSVSYDPGIRLTSVLLLTQSHFHDVDMFVAMMYWKNYKVLMGQPMLVPFLVCTCISNIHAEKVQVSIATLNTVEEEMGQHTYQNRYKGDPLEADFVNTTTALNGNNTRLAINEARLGTLIAALGRICDYIGNVAVEDPCSKDERCILIDHVQHLKDYCQNLLLNNEAERKRTASQLAVVGYFLPKIMERRDSLTMSGIQFHGPKGQSAQHNTRSRLKGDSSIGQK